MKYDVDTENSTVVLISHVYSFKKHKLSQQYGFCIAKLSFKQECQVSFINFRKSAKVKFQKD